MNHYLAQQHSQRIGLDVRDSLPPTYWSNLWLGVFLPLRSSLAKKRNNKALPAMARVLIRVLSRSTCESAINILVICETTSYQNMKGNARYLQIGRRDLTILNLQQPSLAPSNAQISLR